MFSLLLAAAFCHFLLSLPLSSAWEGTPWRQPAGTWTEPAARAVHAVCAVVCHLCRKEAVVCMDHENAFGSGPVRCVSASTYLRLRFLDSHSVSQEVGACHV
jgi:hypothetical protein